MPLERVHSLVTKENRNWGLIILLDERSAFNTTTWSLIFKRLAQLKVSKYLINIIVSYFTRREIDTGCEKIQMTQSVSQGSVLGPILWNVLYDPVLRLDLPVGCTTVAYADDLVLVVTNRDKEGLVENANEALARVQEWMVRCG